MTLSPKVVDFIGPDVIKQIRQLPRNRQIAIMEINPGFWVMKIFVQMINALRVESAGAPDQTVDLITFAEQKLS
jgi:hypothetical protein